MYRLLVVFLILNLCPWNRESRSEDYEFFENRIRPILVKHCYECHAEDSDDVMGGLLVDSKEALRTGGDTQPAVVPGSPQKSLLLEAITYENRDLQMPPDSKLSPQVIADFRQWIKSGAADPRTKKTTSAKKAFDLVSRQKEHWAWQPRLAIAPDLSIDQIVDAKLTEKKWQAAKKAAPRELIRRLSFDLIGLPPSPAEVSSFAESYQRDPEPALEELVDRLLQDPRFGEHWARHWLDVVRYSETKGHVTDQEKPYAYKYRDYVIQAFNEDVPYDQWIREHLAGDLLSDDQIRPGGPGVDNASVIGTSSLFMHEIHFMAVDPVKQRWDEINAQIDVVGKAFLGMTTECARCHDHKFDAISQRDYYALAGIFWSTELGKSRTGKRDPLDETVQNSVAKAEKDLEQFLAQKRKQRKAAQSPKAGGKYFPVSDELGIQSPGDSRQLQTKMQSIVQLDPSWSRWTRAAKDVSGQDVKLLIRGEHRNEGPVVPRGFLTALDRSKIGSRGKSPLKPLCQKSFKQAVAGCGWPNKSLTLTTHSPRGCG